MGSNISAGAAPKSETLDNGKTSENSPDEEAECDSSLSTLAEVVAVAVGGANASGHGDGASEPEKGGDGKDDQRSEAVVEARSEEGNESKVDEHQERPDGAEEEEGERRWSIVPCPPRPLVCYADD